MSQDDLCVLRGAFTPSQTSAVHWQQTGDMREFVQQRDYLCVKCASHVEINVQQLGSAQQSRASIRRDNAQARSDLKESASAVNRDSGPGTCALDGTGDIGLLIPPSFIRALYFQSVLATGFVDRVMQRSEFTQRVRFALPEPRRASVLALENFYNIFASSQDHQPLFAHPFQFIANRIDVFLFPLIRTPPRGGRVAIEWQFGAEFIRMVRLARRNALSPSIGNRPTRTIRARSWSYTCAALCCGEGVGSLLRMRYLA